MWILKKQKSELTDTEKRLVVAKGKGWGWVGEMGEGSQKVQTSSYKISNSLGM